MSHRVKEIWRYPVKSMAGEQLATAVLTPMGIPHDRAWAVRDEKTRTIRGAKHLPRLMACAARFVEDPDGTRLEIYAKDGASGAAPVTGAPTCGFF